MEAHQKRIRSDMGEVMMSTPTSVVLRALDDIPNKEGFVLIGVRRDHSEAELTVYLAMDGTHKVPEFDKLIGWRYP